MSDWAALFILFYISHKIGDYWIQTDWQAQNKASNWWALWLHAATYTATFAPALLIAARSGLIEWRTIVVLIPAIFYPHAAFDSRRPLNWFWVHVKKLSLDPDSHPLFGVLRLEMDQAFHYTCLALAASAVAL